MYGYVRPEKGELKVREYEAYRGVYCGLCHTLRQKYGPLYRFAVNYDFTFLAMLLAGPEPVPACEKRCPYHPLRRTSCPARSESMDAAADHSVILAYWKLRDGVEDKGFFGALGCRVLCAVIRGAYRKAAAQRPVFAAAAEENLKALAQLEAEKCGSVDAAADKFARILQAAAQDAEGESCRRVLRELLYHLGRIVYILDAADDLSEDMKSGNYNPLCFRFRPENGRLSAEDEAELRQSLQHSHNGMASAFALLEKNPYTDILSNILFFGLPAVTQAVFSGTWKASHRERKKRSGQL